MPLVANSDLPTFERLRAKGQVILEPDRAVHQDIRELHIGLLNMMPDSSLEATERQFYTLVGESNPIAQFYMHPFTIAELARGPKAAAHIERFYEPYEAILEQGLDALIITGANVTQPDLALEPFWDSLIRVVEWAERNVTSTLCSCLATHAVLQFRHGQRRRRLSEKRWGVFMHEVVDREHPLVHDVNTLFDVPHSRFNDVGRDQFDAAGLHVLVESAEAGVHLAVSEDWFRLVFFQGHPEYDTISLLKEYKREVSRYAEGELQVFPPFPGHYFGDRDRAIFEEFRDQVDHAQNTGNELPRFPEHLVAPRLHNTWHDSGEAVVGNWIGNVYQITHRERRIPFMEGVDASDPLGLRR